jgi:hypothetical protein
MNAMAASFLRVSPHEADGGEMIAKSPAEISLDELRTLGHPESPIKAIRSKCRDCVYSDAEIRKCVQASCPLWPFRMGRNPFHGQSRGAAAEEEEAEE